ncbi:hypothetical protein Trydic_g21156 [Trypoxylus dichotomus]
MTPTQVHQELVDALGESTVSYGIVERWCRFLKCGRQSCTDEQPGGALTGATTQKTVNKVYDVVLQNRHVTIGQLVEDISHSCHVPYNIITAKLNMKILSAGWILQMLTAAHKQRHLQSSFDAV